MEKKKAIFVGAPIHQAIKRQALEKGVPMSALAEELLIKAIAAEEKGHPGQPG